MLDNVKTRYGIRKIEWKRESGLSLNGKECKLLGVCEHYEGGPVGGEWTRSLLRWKLGLFKDMGVNAIRTAHNPVPPMFYDLCDEMGIMVMDEIFDGWSRKARMDYGAQSFKKDLFYFYQSQWTKKPMVHILPNWTNPTMKKGTKIPIWVYSNCDEVELFLNGKSLGIDKPGKKWNNMQCQWMVPWEPGILSVKGYKSGKEVAYTENKTSLNPACLKLSKNILGDNTIIITTEITDSLGVFYPYGENNIYYNIRGARIISLENGDPVDTTKNTGVNYRRAFMGLTRTFLKAENKAKNVFVIAGAILGEKRQITTNKVYIDVKQISVKENKNKCDYKIFYTTDGTSPTIEGLRYKGPFKVKEGTTGKVLYTKY